ncbi:integration host factor subunit beta [Bacteroidia bacterium]|nr:integration host factor subunit beta [Bacteroidia bacterium]GHT04761.1 integration host factor subunit beta [Bacteroidia bacterium]
MTKADIVNAISRSTGIDRASVLASVEGFMDEVMNAMNNGENVYLRGFGSFVVKKRAAKAARHIKNETTILIPERFVPTFKPSQYFAENLRNNLESDK